MYEYFVSGNQQLTPSTLLLTLKKDSASKPFSFQPGQYAAISFKHHGRPTAVRCFSIVSSPTDQGILQFSMRTKGRYTKALATLGEGEKVIVRGAFGGFVFDSLRDKDTVLLAGGIGITPYMSMLRYMAATNLVSPITLIYSCQNQDDVPFSDELKRIESLNPNFHTIFVIGQGPTDKFTGYNVKTGRISPELIDAVTAGAFRNKSFFICGPPLFLKAINKILVDKKTPKSSIMTEAFGQGSNNQTGKIRSWPLNIYALGAVSVVLGSAAVMVGDLLDTLPPSTLFGSSSAVDVANLTNSRQNDLDQLVNGLPTAAVTTPPTDAAIKAAQQQSSNDTSSPVATPSTTTTTPTPAPLPVVTKPAVVAPKCTTSQSGVTTCV